MSYKVLSVMTLWVWWVGTNNFCRNILVGTNNFCRNILTPTSALKMDAVCSPKTNLPTYHIIMCHNAEDRNMKFHHHRNLKMKEYSPHCTHVWKAFHEYYEHVLEVWSPWQMLCHSTGKPDCVHLCELSCDVVCPLWYMHDIHSNHKDNLAVLCDVSCEHLH